jgi:outer membrane murein-binding lipoprotein Lpp
MKARAKNGVLVVTLSGQYSAPMTRARSSGVSVLAGALVMVVLSAVLLACPKNVPVTVAGTDDEKMDQYSAQLEELKTKTDVQCSDYCTLKSKACSLSTNVCEISGRLADRADFQKKCVTAQEECARFNESCSTCPK